LCIAALLPPNTSMTEEEVIRCSEKNPHGAGVAYVSKKTGKMMLWKTVEEPARTYATICRIREMFPDVNIMVHFRYATHGAVSQRNCHPYAINIGGRFVTYCHNGVFRQHSYFKSEMSDSYHFGEDILEKLGQEFWRNQSIMHLLQRYVDKSASKVIILDPDGGAHILGRSRGVLSGDRWFSNDGFKEYVIYRGHVTSWEKCAAKCGRALYTAQEKEEKICYKCRELYLCNAASDVNTVVMDV
jgi:hypothetical protein